MEQEKQYYKRREICSFAMKDGGIKGKGFMENNMNFSQKMKDDQEKNSFDVFRTLMDEKFGINVLKEHLDVKNLSKYKKADGQELFALSQLFGYIPGFAKDQIQNKNFAEAMKDTYRIIIPKGCHMGKANPRGVQKALLFSDEGSHLKGPADVIANDPTDILSKAPQIEYSVFTLLSFITGQYFMRQLNDSLTQLNDRIDRIIAFLEEDKISEIQAAIDELSEITNKLSYTKGDDIKVLAALNRIHHIQSVARRNMHFYSIQVEKNTEEISAEKKDDNKTIETRINDLSRNLEYYKICLDIYCHAKVAEVGIQTMTSQEMLSYQKDIDVNIEKFRNAFQRADRIRTDYLEKTQKERAFKGGMVVGSASVGLAGMAGIALGGVGSALILNKVSEGIKNKNEKMDDIVDQSKESIISINDDLGKIESYEKIISDWIEMSGKPIEIINVDDEFYIRLNI